MSGTFFWYNGKHRVLFYFTLSLVLCQVRFVLMACKLQNRIQLNVLMGIEAHNPRTLQIYQLHDCGNGCRGAVGGPLFWTWKLEFQTQPHLELIWSLVVMSSSVSSNFLSEPIASHSWCVLNCQHLGNTGGIWLDA